LSGIVRIEIILDDPRVFETGRHVKLIRGGQTQEGEIEFLRKQHGRTVLKLRGIDSIDQAETLVGWELAIAEADLPAPPEGMFYTFHLRGCRVTTVNGEDLGQVTDVLDSGADPIVGGTPVLQVDGTGGQILIPMALSYLKTVDLRNRRIVVELPEELRDLNT